MDPRVYYSKKTEIAFSDDELNNFVYNDYRCLMDVLGYLIQVTNEIPYSENLKYRFFCEPLAKKILMHSSSLLSILQGGKIHLNHIDYEFKFIDISSAYILQRTMLENYLTLFYLYIQPKEENKIRFRCLLYEISGLKTRQGYDAISENSKSKLSEEKQKLHDLLSELKIDPIFNSLNSADQRKILKDTSAKLFGWLKIISCSELYKYLYKQSWLLASNHAHSEYISLIQVKDLWFDNKEVEFFRDLILQTAMPIIAVFISDYKSMFSELEIYFNRLDAETKSVVRFFGDVGRDETSFNT